MDERRLPECVREANAHAGALAVHEIFVSIQGETTHAGRVCAFVRLAGCPLRCRWCDTSHAYEDGELRVLSELLAEVVALGVPLVAVTGGEPLAQTHTAAFVAALAAEVPTVLLETSGAYDIAPIAPPVRRILDLKAPGSGEHESVHWGNLSQLRRGDEIKLVLASREDYEWARRLLDQELSGIDVPVLFAPAAGLLPAAELAEWMTADRVGARLQLQLHKEIWGPDARRR